MDALFIELPAFERHRRDYLSDELFHGFQQELMKNPEAGDVIEGTGGLRKVRFVDERRNKGKRGGLRGHLLLVVRRYAILVIHFVRQTRTERPDATT